MPEPSNTSASSPGICKPSWPVIALSGDRSRTYGLPLAKADKYCGVVPLLPRDRITGLERSKSSNGTTATAIKSIEAAGVGSIKQDVGERGANIVTPVREALDKAMVAYVVKIVDEVPRDIPGGKTVEKTAGEIVPKLIKAADDSRATLDVTRLRFTDKDSGMPDVVNSEKAAVGTSVEEST